MKYSLDTWIQKNAHTLEFDKVDGIYYLTKEIIIFIHDLLIEYFSKSNDAIHRGVLSDGNLEFNLKHTIRIADRTQQASYLKSAHLLNLFLTSHCFVDGNKRTGYVLFLIFLRVNGAHMPLSMDPDYLKHYDFLIVIACRTTADKRNISDILRWIETIKN